jgi:hypothetical protein
MHRRLVLAAVPLLLSSALAAAAIVAFGMLAVTPSHAAPQPAAAASIVAHGAHTGTVATAAVVVQLDGGRSVVRLIDFTEPISGVEALVRSGLDATVAESGFGPAVCAIEGTGCPAEDCFCNPDLFWNYSYWDGTAWQGYPVGASASVISTTGAVEGWRWGAFEGSQAPATGAIAAAGALEWLHSQQDAATGGYGESTAAAVEVALALGANRLSMANWMPAEGERSFADFMRQRATRFSRAGAAEAGKLAVAQAAAGGCRTVRSLQPGAYFSDTLGAYAADSGFNAWGILGTLALSQPVPASAVDALAGQQQADGGWEWQPGFGTDTNTTSLAIQTLIAAGQPVTSSAVISGLAFLKTGQIAGGGFVYDPANPQYGADANSTAYAIQAMVAAGQDPLAEAWHVDGETAVDYLLSLQLPDGSFEWQAGTGTNLLATTQAVAALLGQPYPFASRALESCRRSMP